MDVYRVGTLLELARELATTLAQDGAHVKVCVQQSMGQGVFQVALTSLKWLITRCDTYRATACMVQALHYSPERSNCHSKLNLSCIQPLVCPLHLVYCEGCLQLRMSNLCMRM